MKEKKARSEKTQPPQKIKINLNNPAIEVAMDGFIL